MVKLKAQQIPQLAIALLFFASLMGKPEAMAKEGTPISFTRKIVSMGTELELTLDPSVGRERALQISEDLWKKLLTIEKRISTWDSESELSKINQAPINKPAHLSSELKTDLQRAFQCSVETEGAFSPTLAPLIQAWGIRTGGKVPGSTELKTALAASGAQNFIMDGDTIRKTNGSAGIEEGGFGKGAALDEAIQLLKLNHVNSAELNFGGQIAFLGNELREVEVANPSDRSQVLFKFKTKQTSIATSGNSVHQNIVDDHGHKRTIGHLIHSFTGIPIKEEGSITVVDSSAFLADCKTKVFTLGVSKALDWANRHHEKLFLVSKDRNTHEWIIDTSCDWNEPFIFKDKPIKTIKHCKET